MRGSTWLIVLGIMLLLGGVLAVENPLVASIAVTQLVGIFFLVSGVGQLWLLFQKGSGFDGLWNWIVSAVSVLTGIWLIAEPLAGTVSLTLILGALILMMGAGRLILAFRMRETRYFWFMLLSGVASVLLGLLIFSDFQSAATSFLGIILGVTLIFDGIGLTALGFLIRSPKT